MNTIKRKSVFITSTGRTGTQFLAKTISEMIPNCESVHEPGTLWISKPKRTLKQFKKYGLYKMSLGQIQLKNCMFKLSSFRFQKKIRDEKAKDYIFQMRRELDASKNKEIYLESNGHIYGLTDLFDDVFENSKFIFIIRDPRDWITSALNTLEYILYGPLDPDWLNLSIKAKNLPDDDYYEQWDYMSKFEKYCWYYNRLNNFVLKQMEVKTSFQIYRFEDLFSPVSREKYFTEMLHFIADFDSEIHSNIEFKEELFKKKVHSNSPKKEKWRDWSDTKARILERHCGSLMKKFDYGEEPEWQEKVKLSNRIL